MTWTTQSTLLRLALLLLLGALGAVQAAAADIVAYHDRTFQDHVTQADQLRSQGYRPLTLSVYGNPADPRHAAVWIKRGGPEWTAIYGFAPKDFYKVHADMVKQSFYPALISVVGAGEAARFSVTFERVPPSGQGRAAALNLVPSGVAVSVNEKRGQGFMPRSVSIYGTASQPLYAITWQPASATLAWDAEGINEDGGVYQQRVEAQVAQWARPAFVTVSPFGRYFSVFRDDQVGPVVARHNLTSQGYQAEYSKWVGQGFYPVCVQAGGVGANARFAAIFVKQETPVARKITVTGREVPALAKFDQAMIDGLKKNKARAASLAIAKDGRLVFARSYTWAEPGYPVTTPQSAFRIASCSKPLTSIAVFQLMDRKQMRFFNSVKDLQGFAQLPNSQTIPNNFQHVTVDQLLSHRTSWGDVQQDEAASAYLKTPLPINKYQLAAYNLAQGVPQTPVYGYSNFGYSILGMLIEKVSGMGYYQYVKTQIMAPLGIKAARIAKPMLTEQSQLAVRYHDDMLLVRKSRAEGSGRLRPQPYGGENLTAFDSFGGWEMSAAEYARVLAELSKKDKCILLKDNYNTMFSRPPTGYNDTKGKSETGYGWGWWYEPLGDTPFGKSVRTYSHGGWLPGVRTWICHRTDGIDFVVFYNGEDTRPNLHAIANSIPAASWPAHDLFPEVGIQ